MSPANDGPTDMHRKPLDSSTADRLLGGGVVPDDAPPGLRDLARLIQAAKPVAWAGGGVVEDQVVAAFAATVRTPVAESGNECRKRMLTHWLSIKTAAIAAVGAAVVLGGSAAAAAAGSLPGPVQSAVSGALSHVGISVPNPNPDSRHAPLASSGAGTGNSHG